MLNSFEIPLVQAIAISPNDNAKYLASPMSGNLKEWVSTPLARNFFSRVAYLAINKKDVSFLSILTEPIPTESYPEVYNVSPDETKCLMDVWNSGKNNPGNDIQAAIDTLKNNYIISMSDSSMLNCIARNKADPSNVIKHISEVGATLSILSRMGLHYDPTPSAHKDDPISVVTGTWGNKTFDKMYDGGIPSRGYSLTIGPSGHGKSTVARSQAAFLVAHNVRTDYCTNEDVMDAGEVSRRIHRALKTMWAGTRDDDEIWANMDKYLKVYDLDSGTNDIHQINSFAYWDSPAVLIMDSLDNVNFPKGSERDQDSEKHRKRANYIAKMSKDNGCFTVLVGNGSKNEQEEIIKDITKVTHPMAFGSIWYHNESSYSFVFCRDKTNTSMADIKRCKNRGDDGGFGEMMYFEYDKAGGYYDQPHVVNLNP